LKRADQVLTARINETQQVNGLTRIEWKLFNVLHEVTLATREQLAAPLRPFVDGVALDDVVRRLDQRGLIEGDGSATSPCRLTTPGQELHRAALSQQEKVRQQAVKGISEAEVSAIVSGRPYTGLPDCVARTGVSRDVLDRLVRVGAFDALYGIGAGEEGLRRRDLLLRADAVERSRRGGPGGGQIPLSVAEREHAAHLPAMTPEEEVRTELEVLGYEVSRHLLDGYAEVCAALRRLGAVCARDLHRVPHGREVLVLGVKVATQTPAVRSGQRIIFTTLDDATGLVDLTFFESVQEACAATVFGSWLLVARGRVRRLEGGLPTVNAFEAHDLDALAGVWHAEGAEGLRRAVARRAGASPTGVGGPRIRYTTGYRLSPYADLAPSGGAPRKLWHSSPGSAGL
jgi:error-prone DNA polymerase